MTKAIKQVMLKGMLALTITAALGATMYMCVVYSNIPFIRYWRNMWIETAMTTGDHQWLATSFLPERVIEEVMSHKTDATEVVGGSAYLVPTEPASTEQAPIEQAPIEQAPIESASTEEAPPEEDSILGQNSLIVGEPDYAGYTVLVNDIEQGIVISEIKGANYKGKIMLIDDPSRVFLGVTPYKNEAGLRIKEMLSSYDAIAGMNASGFNDANGNGTGGDVMGLSCSSGEYWGNYANYYGSIILTEENKLVVGNVSVWEQYAIRDGIQFGPVLIADGEKQVEGSAGHGLQPRTAIGQREDGVIAFLVIDGRSLTHSLGCTVGDMADILEKYGIVNAASCDGGSSSVLAYDGEVITKNSSLYPELGRRLPNAFLVRKKTSENG